MSRFRELPASWQTGRSWAAAILFLSLSGCFFYSSEPFIYPNDTFPLTAPILNMEERNMVDGEWRNPTSYQFRRTGRSTYVAIPNNDLAARRAIRFEYLRSRFYAVMWQNSAPADPMTGIRPGYYYALVYMDTNGREFYLWEMGQSRSLRDRQWITLTSACISDFLGPERVRSNDIYVFTGRMTMLAVLRNCSEYVAEHHIQPDRRFTLR